MIRRVAFVVFAQRVGLTLEEARAELAKLPSDRVPTRNDWSRLTATWLRTRCAAGAVCPIRSGMPT